MAIWYAKVRLGRICDGGQVPALGKLKPLSRARRVAPLRKRGTASILTPAFEELLFSHAEVLSEGSCRGGAQKADSYFGSTMISIELDRLRPFLRGELDGEARRALFDAIDGSVRVRLRALRLARAEAARRVPNRVLGTAYVETKIRMTAKQLHIDVDLEVGLRVSSGSGQP